MELNPNIIMAGDRSTIYDPNQAQAEQQKLQAGKIELDQAKINDGLQMLQFAKGRPEAWASVRQAAIRRGFPPEIVPEQYDDQFIDQAMQNLMTQKSGIPANIQNAKYYSSLDEAGKQAYVDANRATPYLNTGQTFVKPLATGGMTNAIPITPKASEMPMFEEEVEKAKVVGKKEGENQAAKDKSFANYEDNKSLLEDTMKTLDNATGSGIGAVRDATAGFFGASTEGAEATGRLKVNSAKLTMQVPRMEGPQSDRDTVLYKEAAGNLADNTLPVPIRKAALARMIEINEKYAPANNPTNQTPAPKAGSTVKWGDL